MSVPIRFPRYLALLAASVVFLSGAWNAQARTWTSTKGKTMQAKFLSIEGDSYKFELSDGRVITVPSDRFVKADQEAAERFNKLGDNTSTKKAAQQVDVLLAKKLKEEGFSSFNDPLPDDLFVRRVYLDIAGRIPTRAEFLEFAESARDDKREALIDDLLLSKGFSSHLFNYFADMYRLHSSDFVNGIRMEPYIEWWRTQLENNRPYDEIVTEMITAEGNVGQNPASGFILRDTGMEFDAFSNFGQVMLGIDISCAQCHDHPFEKWTQGEFYEMAAFFGKTQRTTKRYGQSMMSGGSVAMPNAPENWLEEFNRFAESEKNLDLENPQQSRQFRWFRDALGWNVTDNEYLQTVLPHDFRGSGGKPNEVVDPRTLIGDAAKTGGKTRREGLAEWLTAPENPRFALVIANRMWERAFGRALVTPVHDFSDDMIRRSAQTEVLEYLTEVMKDVDYDLREFMRVIYNTRAYQSLSTREEPAWADKYYFQGPILRRMRAEQAWDSMMVLEHGSEIDKKTGPDGSFYKKLLDVDLHELSHEEVWDRYEMFKRFRGDRMGRAVVSSESASVDASPTILNDDDLRASEMPQPAPPATMLDTFGQSDRFITDDHNYDGSVPQVLALMNGSITRELTGPASKIVEDLDELDGPGDKVRGVFHTILNRFPTRDELALGVGMVEDYGDNGISDLAWALMNSPEFLFIR